MWFPPQTLDEFSQLIKNTGVTHHVILCTRSLLIVLWSILGPMFCHHLFLHTSQKSQILVRFTKSLINFPNFFTSEVDMAYLVTISRAFSSTCINSHQASVQCEVAFSMLLLYQQREITRFQIQEQTVPGFILGTYFWEASFTLHCINRIKSFTENSGNLRILCCKSVNFQIILTC